MKAIALSRCLTAAATCDISVMWVISIMKIFTADFLFTYWGGVCVQRHGCIHGTQAGQVRHIGHIVRKKEEEEAVELGWWLVIKRNMARGTERRQVGKLD